jgi:CxxC motif-containing protein (DUF1111 family)
MARRTVVAAGAILVVACSAQSPPQETPRMLDRAAAKELGAAGTGFGDPLPGLGTAELASFELGKVEFVTADEADEGLGPVFNEASCVACHLGPDTAVGGTNQRLETRFGRTRAGTFDPMADFGGSLIQDQGIGQVSVPSGTYTFVGETVPTDATVRASRRTQPLFGLGLVDATPESTFETIAFLQSIFTPSTAGTPSKVLDPSKGGTPALGRFGWKAQVPSLFVFSADAYLNEMGITSPIFPDENCPQGNCEILKYNPALHTPNDDGTNVARFNDFMTFLGPPPRGPRNLQTEIGNAVAAAIGCLDCHVQTLRTGRNAVAALDRVYYHPFSDFLLHDMGSLGDGITQNQATGRLMRTQPLWGLRTQAKLLHDGRASTIAQAILAHDGQGARARERFKALDQFAHATLIAFLESL